jgi:hypothetical protein
MSASTVVAPPNWLIGDSPMAVSIVFTASNLVERESAIYYLSTSSLVFSCKENLKEGISAKVK